MSKLDTVNILMVDDQPGKLLSYEAILGELRDEHQAIVFSFIFFLLYTSGVLFYSFKDFVKPALPRQTVAEKPVDDWLYDKWGGEDDPKCLAAIDIRRGPGPGKLSLKTLKGPGYTRQIVGQPTADTVMTTRPHGL